MKRLIYLLIAISLIIFLAACGKEEAQNSSEQSAEGVTSIESVEETSEESIVIEETEEESLSYGGTSDESEPPREEEPPYVQRYGYKPRSLYDMFTYVDDMWISADGETYEFVRISEQEKTEFSIDTVWKLTAPESFFTGGRDYALCNQSNVFDLFYALTTLESTKVLVKEPTEDDIAEYGLDEPYRSYGWNIYGSRTITVHMTEPDANGDFYIYGKEGVWGGGAHCAYYDEETFGIGALNAEDFPYISYSEFAFADDRVIINGGRDYMEKIVIELDGETHTVVFPKKELSSDTPTTFDGNVVVYPNDYYLCNFITNIRIRSLYRGTPPEKAELSLTVNHDGTVTKLDFYHLDGEYTYCKVNGESDYCVDDERYNELVEGIQILARGEIIPD
ncbi:MAG: hypothetical protein E7597_00565 [Ruminococcaceae bacterium]|nr:hypothetical protein [Oscillospiraceae bacterium]